MVDGDKILFLFVVLFLGLLLLILGFFGELVFLFSKLLKKFVRIFLFVVLVIKEKKNLFKILDFFINYYYSNYI